MQNNFNFIIDSLLHLLREWDIEHSVRPMKSVTALLGILNRWHPELPLSYQTLLNAPRNIKLFYFNSNKII